MLKKLLTILLIAIAFYIFVILSIKNVQRQQENTRNKNTTESNEERVEVVEEKLLHEQDMDNEEWAFQHERTSSEFTEASQEEITAYIQEVWGDNATYGINLAKCESSLNPGAVSPSGKYVGLYQFDKPTFDSNCNGSREEWKDQVVCTLKLINLGESWRWPNCP